MEEFLKRLMDDSNLIEDGTIAQQDSQIRQIWKLRESVSESLQRNGFVYKYDVSLPINRFYELVEVMRERLGSRAITVGYGHIGDCTLTFI